MVTYTEPADTTIRIAPPVLQSAPAHAARHGSSHSVSGSNLDPAASAKCTM
jgi:hypothetical protein